MRINTKELAMITQILLMDHDRMVYWFEVKAYSPSGAEYLEMVGVK